MPETSPEASLVGRVRDKLTNALATPPALDAPVKPKRGWGRPKHQAFIIETTRDIEVHNVTKPTILARSGAYQVQAGTTLWLPVAVGPGYVSIFASGDPEAITTRAPTGFGAALWSQLMGGKLTNLAMGAFEAPDKGFKIKAWVKWAVIGVLVAVFLGFLAYEWLHNPKGA
jgi:hypothetical protein